MIKNIPCFFYLSFIKSYNTHELKTYCFQKIQMKIIRSFKKILISYMFLAAYNVDVA